MSLFLTQSTDKALQGLHLITQSTPNGQKVQIFLEELADAYGTEWTTTLMLVNPISPADKTMCPNAGVNVQ